MNQGFSYTDVLTEVRGNLGVITLNRPKALNALNIGMIRKIRAVLKDWEKDRTVKAVLFTGAGDRAFCSGGDLKEFHRIGMECKKGAITAKAGAIFFGEEYSLDAQIFHYPKPTISFMDGIAMGGGYGIGGNCKLRIVTERTRFAMPETGIGFFPDVGAVFHLLKAPRNLGRYLALTGVHVDGADVLTAGLAEYFIPSARREEMIEALAGGGDIHRALKAFHDPAHAPGMFSKHAERIKKIFAHKDVLKILKALVDDGTPFALETLNMIESRSPSSVMVTAEHLRRSEGKGFDQVIEEDFILAQHFPERADFYEGIRAAVIDKDKNPKWSPADIESVAAADVASYFAPTGHNLKDLGGF